MSRKVVLGAGLVFLAFLLAATVIDLVRSGPTLLGLVSILVLGLLGSGVLGALREDLDE